VALARDAPGVSECLDDLQPEAAALRVGVTRSGGAGSARIVDLQAQHAVADRRADAHGVVGAQPGVLDAVGHQLGHHQLGIGEHAGVDAPGQGVYDR